MAGRWPRWPMEKKKVFPTLIFHSNPKIFQFLNVPIHSAIYCDSKNVLRSHVKQRHAKEPQGWLNIRLNWFYQCNVQATASLDNVPSSLRQDMGVCKISSTKQLEKTMMMYPQSIAQKHDNKMKVSLLTPLEEDQSIDMKTIICKIIS